MNCSRKWVRIGTRIETEHTTDLKKAAKIARDHCREFGDAYYPALIRMEARLKRKKGKKRR